MKCFRSIGFVQIAATIAGGLLLSACGGADPNPPVANGLSLTTAEDTSISNRLTATTSLADPLVFRLSVLPLHGTVNLNANTGDFTYSPDQDYAGEDTFRFEATAGKLTSQSQSVRISMTPVNDSPVLRAIPALSNSAETRVLAYRLPTTDVDGDALQVIATVEDSSVATVTTDDDALTVNISPITRGITRIHVTVRDAEFSASESFDFSVGDVLKSRSIETNPSAGDAISMTNASDEAVTFKLEHNGFPQFQSKEEIVAFVRSMPALDADEPFERKLWRFVRDNVYHMVPLTAERWFYDSWAILSSQGWGFCGHAAAVYVELARAAGYEARVWGLTGHVVPEIKIDGRWQVYDPDLAIYYHTADKQVAGVADLASDSSLITAPVDPIFTAAGDTFAYSQSLADIYRSEGNNFDGEENFLTENEARFQPVTLPPRAELTYPGRWTSEVIGVDDIIPWPVSYYLQALMSTPSDFVGEVAMPWMLWEIRGEGLVRIDGVEYAVGSEELLTKIQKAERQIPTVEVVSARSPIEFIFFVNAMRFGLEPLNNVKLEGKDVWAIDVSKGNLANDVRADSTVVSSIAKPIP